MKKLLLILSLLLLLTGCRGKIIYGEVQSIMPKGDYIELTIVGKDDIVLADDKTMVYSFSGIEEGLLDGELIRPKITAYDLKRKSGGYYSDRIYVESMILPEPYVLEDRTELTIRKDYTHTTYYTPEGFDILWEQEPVGPHNVSVFGLPAFDQLNEGTQEAILTHYRELGMLYDLNAQLEFAWQCYQKTEDKPMFQAHHLSQDISPSAANDRLIWYTAYVTCPIEDGTHHQSSNQTIFDRNTGNIVDPAELFACSEAELGKRILEIVSMPDTQLSREMEKAFRFEYLNFDSNFLDVCFPAGSLISQNTDHILGIEYQDLDGFIHPCAIPDRIE